MKSTPVHRNKSSRPNTLSYRQRGIGINMNTTVQAVSACSVVPNRQHSTDGKQSHINRKLLPNLVKYVVGRHVNISRMIDGFAIRMDNIAEASWRQPASPAPPRMFCGNRYNMEGPHVAIFPSIHFYHLAKT